MLSEVGDPRADVPPQARSERKDVRRTFSHGKRGDANSGVEAGTLAKQKPKQPAEVGARAIAEKFAQARGLNSQKLPIYFAKLCMEARVGTQFEVRGPLFAGVVATLAQLSAPS